MKLDLSQMLEKLLQNLGERGRQVVAERFNLDGKGERTLEEIGNECGITRERIRQIQVESIKKLKTVAKEHKEFETVIKIAFFLLEKNGGAMSEKSLSDALFGKNGKESYITIDGVDIEFPTDTLINRQVLALILNINGKLILGKETESLERFWATSEENAKMALGIVDAIKKIFSEKKEAIDRKSLLAKVQALDQFKGKNIQENVLVSCLSISKEISQNPFGMWGMTEWDEITPKGVRGKIYLILKNSNKPLHFVKITTLINDIVWPGEKSKNVKKIAKSETVHNELIKDSRFVLVGRGTYALREWGYDPGTVLDVILKIFAKENKPMSREEIIQKVLKERFVKVNTIIFNLHNSGRFERKGDIYRLKSEAAAEVAKAVQA